MGMKKAALVAISTPLGEMNWFTKLMRHTTKSKVINELGIESEAEELFFHTLHIGLICDNCMKLQDPDKMSECTHMAYLEPPWKGGGRRERIKQLSLAFGDSARGIRENAGMVADSQVGKAFPLPLVRKLFGEEHLTRSCKNPSFILMAIDPGAGGGSETAIISGYFLNEPWNRSCFTGVIVGVDAKKCSDHLIQENMIIGHLLELRRRYPDARIIVVPENQTGYFHTRIDSMIPTRPNCVVFHQTDKKAGVCKTSIITANYVQCLADALHEEAVAFDEDWFTTTVTRKDASDQIKCIRDELKGELIRFGFDEDNRKLTGKIGSFTDDKAIAAMMMFYWGRELLRASPSNPYLDYLPDQAKAQFVIPQLRLAQGQ
jgi:hypothetical protein